MHAISDAFDATLLSVMVFLFRFLLWYTVIVVVLLLVLLSWLAGWFPRSCDSDKVDPL